MRFEVPSTLLEQEKWSNTHKSSARMDQVWPNPNLNPKSPSLINPQTFHSNRIFLKSCLIVELGSIIDLIKLEKEQMQKMQISSQEMQYPFQTLQLPGTISSITSAATFQNHSLKIFVILMSLGLILPTFHSRFSIQMIFLLLFRLHYSQGRFLSQSSTIWPLCCNLWCWWRLWWRRKML